MFSLLLAYEVRFVVHFSDDAFLAFVEHFRRDGDGDSHDTIRAFNICVPREVRLRRRVPYQASKQLLPTLPATNSHVLIAFGSQHFRVRCDRLRFSTTQHTAYRPDMSTLRPHQLDAFPDINDAVFTIPATDADGELERRFGAKDLRLCVLWINEYDNETIRTRCAECRTQPVYFLCRVGMSFYEDHVVVPDNTKATLQRLLSLLAAAHLLGLPSLETQLQSILLTPYMTPYRALMEPRLKSAGC